MRVLTCAVWRPAHPRDIPISIGTTDPSSMLKPPSRSDALCHEGVVIAPPYLRPSYMQRDRPDGISRQGAHDVVAGSLISRAEPCQASKQSGNPVPKEQTYGCRSPHVFPRRTRTMVRRDRVSPWARHTGNISRACMHVVLAWLSPMHGGRGSVLYHTPFSVLVSRGVLTILLRHITSVVRIGPFIFCQMTVRACGGWIAVSGALLQ